MSLLLFILLVAFHVTLSNALESIASLEIQTSSRDSSDTANTVYVTLWFDSAIYQTSLSSPQWNRKYTRTPANIGSYCIMDMTDTKVMIDNDISDAVIIDWIKFTTSSGIWYGINAVCAPSEYIGDSHWDGWWESEPNCPSGYTMDDFCIDNEIDDCAPAKQIYHFDTSKPNNYILYARRESGIGVVAESNTCEPTKNPTNKPTIKPTNNPTNKPTNNPTIKPTNEPSKNPTHKPTKTPINNPTNGPTNNPNNTPTLPPTSNPTTSTVPLNVATFLPSNVPTLPSSHSENTETNGVAVTHTRITGGSDDITTKKDAVPFSMLYVTLYAMGGSILCIIIMICVCGMLYCAMRENKSRQKGTEFTTRQKTVPVPQTNTTELRRHVQKTQAPQERVSERQTHDLFTELKHKMKHNATPKPCLEQVRSQSAAAALDEVQIEHSFDRNDAEDFAEGIGPKKDLHDVISNMISNDFEIIGDDETNRGGDIGTMR